MLTLVFWFFWLIVQQSVPTKLFDQTRVPPRALTFPHNSDVAQPRVPLRLTGHPDTRFEAY